MTADGGVRGRRGIDGRLIVTPEDAALDDARRSVQELEHVTAQLDEFERLDRRRRELLAEIRERLEPEESLQRRKIVDAHRRVTDSGRKGTVEETAAELGMSESGLKRLKNGLGLTGWPPSLDPD